ncbi:VWA domain-containing protein [Thiovibrio sp. JS02]
MPRTDLKKRFAEAVFPDILSDWEIEELLEPLLALPEAHLAETLRQVKVIWPVSHALCGNFLHRVENGLRCLEPAQLAEWVKAVLAAYEDGGLLAAQRLLENVEDNFLCRLRGESAARFPTAAKSLTPYACGLFGHPVELVSGAEVYTDTEKIILPPEINLFPKQRDNFLLYKLTISFQWAFARLGTFRATLADDSPIVTALKQRHRRRIVAAGPWLSDFFQLFPRPETAARLYHLSETARAAAFLRDMLPGLMRQCLPLLALLREALPGNADSRIDGLQNRILAPDREAMAAAESAADSLRFLAETYDHCIDGEDRLPALPFQGVLRLNEVQAVRRKRREEAKAKFIRALAPLVAAASRETGHEEGERSEARMPKLAADQAQALLIPPEQQKKEPGITPVSEQETGTFITVDDLPLPLPKDLRQLAREIMDDLGHIPSQYISSAMNLSGRAIARGAPPPGPGGEALSGVNVYDEWDYRRMDFRKNWCSLRLKDIPPTRGTFIGATLAKYKGHLLRLRRQFEMMRTQERFMKRQKEGDDIDLDALTESLADLKAGLPPSENLFIRLAREQRSIAALFLIDMSSSTEGWVSTAIKESLVLLCEALGALGDAYGIYGFSGMRRTRAELFHIKHLNEPYNDEVKGRIAAISPQEYTRMGPPIRHLSGILAESEAKIRLLITLSDGKPEDYDDYKGDYAIEDTRHALIEAKARGIHPFCITIDRQAHDYIAHMYGEVNYIFINDVKKLPNRIPEIYRSLTS